ncbi:hypothetical protein M0804_009414 [Polistes exclamans]|nr:hypothetical protein M0804_009414 [Polistes exclamans]
MVSVPLARKAKLDNRDVPPINEMFRESSSKKERGTVGSSCLSDNSVPFRRLRSSMFPSSSSSNSSSKSRSSSYQLVSFFSPPRNVTGDIYGEP